MSQKFYYLYVGCGAHRIKGFVHVEINVAKQYKKGGDVGQPDLIADITENIPLQDEIVSLIFSRATLEHLTYQELINHFLECHRLIKKGGYILHKGKFLWGKNNSTYNITPKSGYLFDHGD